MEKLQPYLEINEEQQGFCPNRSITDITFIVCKMTEKAIQCNVPDFMCFVDLKNAFDRVKRLINIVEIKEVPNGYTAW